MDNEVLRTIFERRSVRSFLDKQVPEQTVKTILKAGVMAPSAMNRQPWRFAVVEDSAKIAEYNEKAIAACKEANIEEKVGFSLDGRTLFFNAPLLVFVTAERSWDWKRDDCNLCIQNMFLAAKSLGLGSCWIGFGIALDSDSQVREDLNIPDSEEIIATLVFGYPKRDHNAVPDREVVIHQWLR
ncbi:MAG: nitroreductase family protein [Nanobdellota archaeon]